MQIFFSYGHDIHSKVVKKLADAIELLSHGEITVWIDTHKIERDSHWREKITRGIYESDSVIAFLSDYSSREKSVCLDELAIALVSKHGMIKTILLDSRETFTPPSLVSEYQWGDMSDYRSYEEAGEQVFDEYINNEAKKIISLVSSDEINKYTSEINFLKEKLNLDEIDRITKFDNLIGEELTGREWLFEKINHWSEDKDGKQIMMIYGKPGAGKSMFAAHLQMRNPHVAAAFPCDCRSDEYSSTDGIIRNIAYRLALRLPDYRCTLLKVLENESFDYSDGDLFNRIITQPLSNCIIDGGRGNIVIVVDALDEMKNDTLSDFIHDYVPQMKKYIRFLITSRKEAGIVEQFNSFDSIDMDSAENEFKNDLKSYYIRRLYNELEKYDGREEFIDRLTDSSDMMFTYAKCVCENILDDIQEGIFRIKDYPLPHGIEQLFKATLDRKFSGRNTRYTIDDYEDFWQKPLGMILASPEPMHTETLRKLMNWKERELKKFRLALSGLITDTEGYLQLFHKSFAEWLDSTNTKYSVSGEDGISDTAMACYEIYSDDINELDEYMMLYMTQMLRNSGTARKEYKEVTDNKTYTEKLLEHADELEKQNKFSRALLFYEELLNIHDCEDFDAGEGEKICSHVMILSRKANIFSVRNQLNKAGEYYKKVLEITERLIGIYPEDKNYLKNYAVSLDSAAGIFKIQNKISEAFKLYISSLEIRKVLTDEFPGNAECLRDYSISLNNIAGIYESQNNINKAGSLYKEALIISRKLVKSYPENEKISERLQCVADTYCRNIQSKE